MRSSIGLFNYRKTLQYSAHGEWEGDILSGVEIEKGGGGGGGVTREGTYFKSEKC